MTAVYSQETMRFGLAALPLLASLSLSPLVRVATAQTWDSSGNAMLNGTYYFRETGYVLADYLGDLNNAVALYGNIAFDGKGGYTINATGVTPNNAGPYATTATYAIAASAYGYIPSPLAQGANIYGLVSYQGIF